MYTHKRSAAQIARETLWTRARDDPNPTKEEREPRLVFEKDYFLISLFFFVREDFEPALLSSCGWVFPSLLSFLIIKKKRKGGETFLASVRAYQTLLRVDDDPLDPPADRV